MISKWLSRVSVAALILCSAAAHAAVSYQQNSGGILVRNSRLQFKIAGTGSGEGNIYSVTLDGQELVGTSVGGYMDWNEGANYDRLGHTDAAFTTMSVRQATDSTGVGYVDVSIHHASNPANADLDVIQHYILRDGETGIHEFTVVSNDTTTDVGPAQMRTAFFGDAGIFTQFSTEDNVECPAPLNADLNSTNTVQDSTWDLINYPNDPYYAGTGRRYFSKYDLCGFEQDHTVHGYWGTAKGVGYGAWICQGNKDTLTGGPTRYELDEHQGPALLNCFFSGHFGSKQPTITGTSAGVRTWQRTYGPFFLYFDKATSLDLSRADAKQYATPTFDDAFYDSLAIPGYVPSTQRSTVSGQITLSTGQSMAGALAILSQNGIDFQAAVDQNMRQYWTYINADGTFQIGHVCPGTYRLTVYKSGVFGEYDQDGVTVGAATAASAGSHVWTPPTHGSELWRIGNPDRTAAEFYHGNEYRIFWGNYDYNADFPNGVVFTPGTSNPARDWNYVQWGAYPPFSTTAPHASDWDIRFNLAQVPTAATLTVALASIYNSGNNGSLEVAVNGYNTNQRLYWTVTNTGEGAIRSGITAYAQTNTFAIPASLLHTGVNNIYLRCPSTGQNIQYDAIRLEGVLPTATLSGTIQLQGWSGAPQPVTVTLTPTDATGVALSQAVTPAPDGSFSLGNVVKAPYTMSVKGASWLRKTLTVNASGGNVSGLNFLLPAGDLTGDNEVSAQDLGRLRAAVGATSSSSNWYAPADLDGDGKVTSADAALLLGNYGKHGDK